MQPNTAHLIDRADELVVELQRIMLELDSRSRLNLGANLERIARLAEVRAVDQPDRADA